MPRRGEASTFRERRAQDVCPAALGLWRPLAMANTRGRGGRALAAMEAGMTNAPKISRAQAIALPRTAPAPAASTEWIVAGIAVLLLLAGLLF